MFQAARPRAVGITNGIDQSAWDPSTEKASRRTYNWKHLEGKERWKVALERALRGAEEVDAPWSGFAGGGGAEGLDVIFASDQPPNFDAQFVFLVAANKRYADPPPKSRRALLERVGAVTTFSDWMEGRPTAASDMFLMPRSTSRVPDADAGAVPRHACR